MSKHISRMPRWWHRMRAALGGYFWLPCPLCGRYFGGHEWLIHGGQPCTIPTGEPGQGEGICPACTRAGLGREIPLVVP